LTKFGILCWICGRPQETGRILKLLFIDADSGFGFLYNMDVGDAAEVSEIHFASIFNVEVWNGVEGGGEIIVS
jgi:hypothetical protein